MADNLDEVASELGALCHGGVIPTKPLHALSRKCGRSVLIVFSRGDVFIPIDIITAML